MSNYNLIYLGTNDFYVGEGSKGKMLCNNLKDLTFVFFHTDPDRCEHCEELIPIFRRLPQFISSCKFALVNLNKNQEIIKMSYSSITPLKHVPYLMLYVNGKPFLRYDGERTLQDLVDFINEVLFRIKSKSKFVDNKNVLKVQEEIPAFTVGVPYNIRCDEESGKCYVQYSDIMGGKK
jgi:hypothetical protein